MDPASIAVEEVAGAFRALFIGNVLRHTSTLPLSSWIHFRPLAIFKSASAPMGPYSVRLQHHTVSH